MKRKIVHINVCTSKCHQGKIDIEITIEFTVSIAEFHAKFPRRISSHTIFIFVINSFRVANFCFQR